MGAGQTTSQRVTAHIRGNIWGIVAVFIALGGTATALDGKNTVDSGDIKKANVKRSDLAPNSVDSSKVVDASLTGADVADNSLTGTDVNESTLNLQQPTIPSSLPPSGPASGDLSGDYPNPQVVESGLTAGGDVTGVLNATQIAGNAVGNAEIGNLTRSILIPVSEINLATASAAEADPSPGANGNTPALRFDPTTPQAIDVLSRVPIDRVPGTSMSVLLHWSVATATNAPMRWEVRAASFDEGDLVNATPVLGESRLLEPGVDELTVNSFTIDAASPQNGEMLLVRVARDPLAADDQANQEGFLHMVEVTYTAER